MQNKFRNLGAAAMAAFLLASCGGGGGGGSGSSSQPPAPSNAWLQLTPSSLSLTAYEGRPAEFSVSAKSGKVISQTFNIGIIEASGLVSTNVGLKKISDMEYSATLRTSDKLAAGTYNSKLEVRLCLDDPTICAQPVDGSPWSLPLSVTVKPATNLSALSDLPSVGPWSTAGGNVAHANYAPVRLDPLKFSQRWNYNFPNAGEGRPGNVVYANGIAFVLTSESSNTYLRALEESSGRVLWTQTYNYAYSGYSGLTLAGDKLYLVNHASDAMGHSVLNAYSQKTGQLLFQTALENVDAYSQPLVVNGAIFLHGPTGPGGSFTTTYHISKVDANTGALLARTTMQMPPTQTLTADSQYLYAFTAYGKLAVVRQSTLEIVADGTDTANCNRGRLNVMGSTGVVVDLCPGRLTAYDTIARKAAWELTGDYNDAIAVAGDTIYATKGDALEARAAADGKLLWSAPMKIISGGAVLATDNLVFVSNGLSTVAIDTTSHQVVWNFPAGGAMSLSSKGVLYLTQAIPGIGRVGNVVAINLQ